MFVVMGSSPVFASLIYTGSLGQANLVENGIFSSALTTLSWIVTQNQNDWTYQYHWTTDSSKAKNVYYLDFLTNNPSGTPTQGSLVSAASAPLTYNLVGPGSLTVNFSSWTDAGHTNNISFNQTFYGLKFDFNPNTNNNAYKDMTLTFNASQTPMWGSFFGDGGSTNSFGEAIVYNSQFGVATNAAVGNGNNGGYLLTPGVIVPEPSTYLLLTLSLGVVAFVRRKLTH